MITDEKLKELFTDVYHEEGRTVQAAVTMCLDVIRYDRACRRGPTGRFEWHITVDKAHRSIAMMLAKQRGHTFSEITGCPILGQGTYCYITGFSVEGAVARFDMDLTCQALVMLSLRRAATALRS